MCFSWGAGANDFGDKNLWKLNMFRDAPINSCITAIEKGLKIAEFADPPNVYDHRIAQHYNLFDKEIYNLGFIMGPNDGRMTCTVIYR